MLHPRGPPAGDPATQTAGGLVRLSSVEAASAAIAALNERPSLTGPGGPPLLVSQHLFCSSSVCRVTLAGRCRCPQQWLQQMASSPLSGAVDSCLHTTVLYNMPLALPPTPGNMASHAHSRCPGSCVTAVRVMQSARAMSPLLPQQFWRKQLASASFIKQVGTGTCGLTRCVPESTGAVRGHIRGKAAEGGPEAALCRRPSLARR